MIPIITSEHLTLTPALKADINKHLAKLEPLLREDSGLRVFIRVDRKNHFQVLLKSHFDHHEIVAEKKSYDLHTALTEACASFRRLVTESKSKRVHLRRVAHATV